MALTIPAHRIQTIHGVFGSPSWSSILPASGASTSHESSFNSLPNTSLSSIRSRGTNLAILAARTATPSLPPTPIVTRPRRSSIHGVNAPVSTRRAPPPPPLARTAIALSEDPFADISPVDQQFTVEALPPPRAQTRTTQSIARTQLATYASANSSYAYPSVTTQRVQSDNRTAKLVASVLLSRASGKPMRRRFPSTGGKSYVKSGLSQMVAVEC